MKRVFSLAQHTVPTWHPAEMIYNSFQLGYDMVGIRAIRQGVPGELFYDLTDKEHVFKAARQAIEETGVKIHDIDLVAIHDDTNIAAHEAAIAAAAELNVQGVVCSVWTPNKLAYTQKFEEICKLTAKYGMTTNLEFVTWSDLKDLAAARELLQQTGCDNARILVDTLHWHRSRVKFSDLEGCPQKWFDLIHICDISPDMPESNEELARTGRQERLYPGEGAAEIRQVVDAINEDAIIALEIPNKRRLEQYGAYEYARRCLETAKSYLADAGQQG